MSKREHPVVIVEVLGGVAEVTASCRGTESVVIDWDNIRDAGGGAKEIPAMSRLAYRLLPAITKRELAKVRKAARAEKRSNA